MQHSHSQRNSLKKNKGWAIETRAGQSYGKALIKVRWLKYPKILASCKTLLNQLSKIRNEYSTNPPKGCYQVEDIQAKVMMLPPPGFTMGRVISSVGFLKTSRG